MSILLPFLLLLVVAAIASYHRFSLAVFAALAGTVLVACQLGGVNSTAVIVAAALLAVFVLPLLITPIRQKLVTAPLLRFYTKILRTGNTSVTIDVEVFAERRLPEPNRIAHFKVTEATLTYVAIGSDRRPRQLPPSNEGT